MRAHALLVYMNNILDTGLWFLAQAAPMVSINRGAGLIQMYIILGAIACLAVGGLSLAVQRDWGHLPHLFAGVAIAAGAFSAVNWLFAAAGGGGVNPTALGLWTMGL